MRLIDAIDNIFSHNEIIAIWEEEDEHHDILVWYGMAWQLPEEYKNIEKWQIVGAIADKITESDRINININDAVRLVQNAEPVRHGKWIEVVVAETDTSRLINWECSECAIVVDHNTDNYCPNCGARMDGE